jgi:cytochrome c553
MAGQIMQNAGYAADPADTAEGIQFFESKIRPVLIEHCYRCHSTEGSAVRGGLMVDSREGLRGGGESGAAVVPESLEDSLLWNAINFVDFEMPPKRKLPAETIKDFERWILMGAPDPRRAEQPIAQTQITPEAIEQGRSHWSFTPPVMPPIPSVADRDWPAGEIDQFVRSAQEMHQLQPVEQAESFALLRRLYFDLIGIPPTPADAKRFDNAWQRDSQAAIDSEIDRLLDRQQFGERWGRHWLDVVRYAESTGKEVDQTYPHAWRYRDWVIDAFNADKPYDQFIQQQIAGDLLPVQTDQQWTDNLIATGFLALGPKTLVERNPRQFQADVIDEQIDVTTRVVMGLSVACARCHDHKFDPIPQTDYYALAGIFQSTETLFGGSSNQRVRQGSQLIILPVSDSNANQAPIAASRLDEMRSELEVKERELQAAAQQQRALLRATGSETSEQEARRIRLRVVLLEREISQLRERLNQYDASGNPIAMCMGVQDSDSIAEARLLVRGEINQPAQSVARGFVQVVCDDPIALPADSSGRLQFARWITDPRHPLTARVMVNRIWMHLIDRPLVAETDNFGRSAEPPSHPELLDYLAIRFVQSGWSVKQMIREIARSKTYRLAATAPPQLVLVDPENRFFARGPRKRLEAEAIRDAMLVASGQIDFDRPRGSAISELGATILGPDGIAAPSPSTPLRRPQPLTEFTANYRSIYLPISRNAVPRSLQVFDFAEPTMVVGQREQSNTATQALYLLNNEFVIQQSERFAQRVMAESRSVSDAVRLAFLTAYGRPPSENEATAAIDFLEAAKSDRLAGNGRGQADVADQSNDARENFGRGRFAGPANARPALRAARERFRATLEARGAEPQAIGPMAQFCQALFASAEFRYLD